MGYILLTALAGAAGGLGAWAIAEPFAPSSFFDPAWEKWGVMFSLLIGAMVSGALGGILGWNQGGRLHVLRGLGIGIVLGAIGGSSGLRAGSTLAESVFGNVLSQPGLSASHIPARILMFTVFGIVLGAVVGVTTLTPRQILIGAIGGAIGGALSGATFDLISTMTQDISRQMRGGDEVGIVGRALTSLTIGGSIGLFTSLVRRIARTAWLRLSLGRNEGREWAVEAGQTFIGRSESAQVPLFGDMSIAPMHACIVRQGPAYILCDSVASPVGTLLNGVPVQQAPLFHGAQIRVGQYVLEFLMRTGSAPQQAAEAHRGQGVPIPVQMGSATMMPSVPMNQPAPGLAIIAIWGPDAGQRYLVAGPVEIGREASGISVGPDTMASRRHAMLSPTTAGLVLTDLSSTNGTFVNDRRVQNATLRPGDVLRIGSSAFRVE